MTKRIEAQMKKIAQLDERIAALMSQRATEEEKLADMWNDSYRRKAKEADRHSLPSNGCVTRRSATWCASKGAMGGSASGRR